MIESVEDFGNRWRDRALEAEIEIGRLRADSQAENARLRQVIAHLMTNPLGHREAVYYTSDIDGQTGHVDITDGPDDRTTIRITEDKAGEFLNYMASRDPQQLEADRAAAWGDGRTTER